MHSPQPAIDPQLPRAGRYRHNASRKPSPLVAVELPEWVVRDSNTSIPGPSDSSHSNSTDANAARPPRSSVLFASLRNPIRRPRFNSRPSTAAATNPLPLPRETDEWGFPLAAVRGTTDSQPQHRPSPSAEVHPEIRSFAGVVAKLESKIYVSGSLFRVETREGWPDGESRLVEIWAQLKGTTLNIWDMSEIRGARALGKEAVAPSYTSVTDTLVQVLGSIKVPATPISPPQRYDNVFSLSCVGSSTLLFSCPTKESLISWVSALRLATWERSHMDEAYTALLIKIHLSDGQYKSPLVNGQIEGWVRVRVAAQSVWRKLWMVASQGKGLPPLPQNADTVPPPARGARRSMFSRNTHAALPANALIEFYTSPKSKSARMPVLTVRAVSQAYAVYPVRPENIHLSTLVKMIGVIGTEDATLAMKGTESWIWIVLPDHTNCISEMLKWIVGLHDAFELYGRPLHYIWNQRNPSSLMFGWPSGIRAHVPFLDPGSGATLEPFDGRPSLVRSHMHALLVQRLRSIATAPTSLSDLLVPRAFRASIGSLPSAESAL